VPAKNSVKEYESDAFYHIYNRGVEKRDIFLDPQDYKVFISYLANYLSPPDLQGQTLKVSPSRLLKNYYETIKLTCYCLMPNHFHLLLQQAQLYTIAEFMKSISTKYTVFFNRKYKRVGGLFQGRYKAVKVQSDEQLIYLTKYIHLNPSDLQPSRSDLEVANYPYSSVGNYLHKFTQSWIHSDLILNNFDKKATRNSYHSFLFSNPALNPLADELTLD